MFLYLLELFPQLLMTSRELSFRAHFGKILPPATDRQMSYQCPKKYYRYWETGIELGN